MPTRASKNLQEMEETNSVAARIVALTTGQKPLEPPKEKNAAAVALGKLGASKGGIARAENLTSKRRKQIARKAAESRWAKSRARATVRS
jgi:hypothetical protein